VAGKLSGPQAVFWNPKPAEELYDVTADPDEVHNLAASAEHREKLAEQRRAQQDHARRICDVGFLHEGEMHARAQGTTPYDMGHDRAAYPLEKVLAAAELIANTDHGHASAASALAGMLGDGDSAVRYWAAMGLLIRGADGVAAGRGPLSAALEDRSPYVRIVAAEALLRYGDSQDASTARQTLAASCDWGSNDVFVTMAALNSLEECGDRAAPLAAEIRKLPLRGQMPHNRYSSYVPRLLERWKK
jgi:uncharacterized sulfatase